MGDRPWGAAVCGQAGGGSEGVLPPRSHAAAHRQRGEGLVTTYLGDLDGLPLLVDNSCTPSLQPDGFVTYAP
jgi:hypothetical protein